MTDELRARIHHVARSYPDWSLYQIGVECGCNQGRVFEVVAGVRS